MEPNSGSPPILEQLEARQQALEFERQYLEAESQLLNKFSATLRDIRRDFEEKKKQIVNAVTAEYEGRRRALTEHYNNEMEKLNQACSIQAHDVCSQAEAELGQNERRLAEEYTKEVEGLKNQLYNQRALKSGMSHIFGQGSNRDVEALQKNNIGVSDGQQELSVQDNQRQSMDLIQSFNEPFPKKIESTTDISHDRQQQIACSTDQMSDETSSSSDTAMEIADNSFNSGSSARKKKTSVFRGVSQSGSGWTAQITNGSKKIYLGYFLSDRDAAKAYDLAARQYHGQRAKCNFPSQEANLEEANQPEVANKQ